MTITKISESFQFDDRSQNNWYSFGSITEYSDKSKTIDLSLYSYNGYNSVYVKYIIDSLGETTTEWDGFKENFDNLLEYIEYLINSILKYFNN